MHVFESCFFVVLKSFFCRIACIFSSGRILRACALANTVVAQFNGNKKRACFHVIHYILHYTHKVVSLYFLFHSYGINTQFIHWMFKTELCTLHNNAAGSYVKCVSKMYGNHPYSLRFCIWFKIVKWKYGAVNKNVIDVQAFLNVYLFVSVRMRMYVFLFVVCQHWQNTFAPSQDSASSYRDY